MATNCKTCIHKKVCDLWKAEECQCARSFFDGECELYAEVPCWIPVTDNNLPNEGEEVLVYDGCYRVAKIKKGISVDDRERMKRGEIPDPEEWGWNVAEGYFRVRRSEAYKACDEQGNNEKPYCWQVDNGHGTLFGQDVKYWMPLFKLQKEENHGSV